MQEATPRPVRVAIIGGGCASMTAAFELTRPEHEGRYAVTVYQVGWRLGGKGASGRGPSDRIEEHGLHLWMGYYENAFRLMRECYAELGRDPQQTRIADWTDAFFPANYNAVADWSPRAGWLPWKVTFAPSPGLPGDTDPGPRWTVADYLARTVALVRTLFETIQVRVSGGAPPATAADPEPPPATIEERFSRLLRFGELGSVAAVLEALRLLEVGFRAWPATSDAVLLRFHQAVVAATRTQLEALLDRDDEIRRLWEIADLALAVVRGAIRFRLATDPRGFDAIDDHDCREWLRDNGASERAINSAFVRGLYDLAFAYDDGDVERPRISAGQSLRAAMRAFFTYRGAFFWKMRAGMGDVVFAPLYELLRRRGARFAFFHRLTNVGIAEGRPGARPFVDRLELDVQAEIAGGRDYQPLVDVRGLPCWPSAPDWRQLEGGERLRAEGLDFESHWDRRRTRTLTLRAGADFDLVVLGVGLGEIPQVCREILARDERWRTMVARVKSVPTQAFQIWTGPSMPELGWTAGQINLSGFVEPFDTWADMSHLGAEESWPRRPGAIAYFCSVLRDGPAAERESPAHRNTQRQVVRENAVRFLNRDVGHLWPGATRAGQFRWDALLAPSAAAGDRRFDTQYWTANVNPSDRYVLSLPGSSRFRISPLDHTYDNLTIAGDWTDCGYNLGCVEAAVMSGRLAAHALSRSPPLEEIVGFDHP